MPTNAVGSTPVDVAASPSPCGESEVARKGDLARVVPATSDGVCLDPHATLAVLGEEHGESVEEGCAALLAERCVELERHGLSKLVRARYVEREGGTSSVQLLLLRFQSVEGAHAYFGARLFGEGHPSEIRARRLASRGVLLQQDEWALSLQGPLVFEATFRAPDLPAERARERAAPVLDALARRIEASLPQNPAVPVEVRLLPEPERLAFGVRYFSGDVLGVRGAGPGALGYYQRGERRYQVYVNEAVDEAAARDIERTFRAQEGHRRSKDMPYDAFELVLPTPGGPARWLLARQFGRLVGVGDDFFGVEPERDARAAHSLSRLEKFRLVRDTLAARPGVEPRVNPIELP